MPEKSASSQVRPNTPGGRGQAPIQSGETGLRREPATDPIHAVDQGEQAAGVVPASAGVVPAQPVDPNSPGAMLARDNEAKAKAEADPSAPTHCTVCGLELVGDVELARGPFDERTGEQHTDQQETGGGPGNVAILLCPTAIHETWRKEGGSWTKEDSRGSADEAEGRA